MDEDEDRLVEVDLARKETEAGWARLLDNFGKKAAPVWFNWLAWTLIIAAFQYLLIKTRNAAVVVILSVSLFLLLLHMQAHFFRLRFKNIPVLRRWDHSHVPSIILAALLAWGGWYGALQIARLIAANQTQ